MHNRIYSYYKFNAITVSTESAPLSDESISLDFNVTGKWDNGFNGEITVNNLTDKVIENWQIKFEFPQEITNIWNAAVVSHEDIVYTVKNSGGNNNVNIPANGSVAFGFSGTYEGEIIAPAKVSLVTGKSSAESGSYTVAYSLLSDWGSGYTAQLTITNNTDKPMEAWHIAFDFDREINSIWNAVIEGCEENHYTVSNAEYNSVIPSGKSVTFGFSGTGGSSENEPCNYTLTCSGDGVVIDTEDKDIDYEKDTDSDNLPDWYEQIIGTSIYEIDSDFDGITDYDEAALTDTNPTKYDTDEDGICDADEDRDFDNITNSQEIELGTYPLESDSDFDCLSDYDELYIYHTNPLKYDSDYDSLSDSEEIALGLNPNASDSNGDGIADCDEKIEQTLTKEINCNELPGITQVSVTMPVSGVIDNSVEITNMYNKNVLSTNLVGIIGAPMDITCSQNFDTAELSFTYDETALGIEPENLGILWYNEDEQFYYVMDTVLDKKNHRITMTAEHFSEYTTVDLNAWFKAWEEKIDYEAASILAANADWNGKVVTAEQLCDEYNNCFGYDDKPELSAILPLSENGDIYAQTGTVHITVSTGESMEYDCLFLSIYQFDQLGLRRFLLSDSSYGAYPIPSCGGWTVSVLKPVTMLYNIPDYDNGNRWPKLADITNIDYRLYDRFFMPSGQADTTDDDNDGLYDIYELTGMRIANGQVIFTNTNTDAAEEENETLGFDTDGDGLSDGEEIIRHNTERGYFVMKSNPKSLDSDDDGLYDNEDLEPLKPSNNEFMTDSSDTSERMIKLNDFENWDIKYRDKFITDLQRLTNLCFSLYYDGDDAYITFRRNASGSPIKINDNLPEYDKSVYLVEQMLSSDIQVSVNLDVSEHTEGFAEEHLNGIKINYAPTKVIFDFMATGEYHEECSIGELRMRPLSSTYIALSHEFIHALHHINKISMDNTEINTQYISCFYVCVDGIFEKFYDVTTLEEMFTIGTIKNPNIDDTYLSVTENDIRNEHSLPRRLTHAGISVVTEKEGLEITYKDWLSKL